MPEFGKPQPIIYKRKEEERKPIDIVDIGIKEFATPEQLKMYGLQPPAVYKKEPEKTESREWKPGQISEEAQERQRQQNALVKEYQNYFLTQTELGQTKEWAELIPKMGLKQLENLNEEYQEHQARRQQQVVTQFTEQLGIPSAWVGQLQETYPEKELASLLPALGTYWQMLQEKPSASMTEDFFRFLFGKDMGQKEPTTYETLRNLGLYGELKEKGVEVPIEMESELDPTARSLIEDVTTGLQTEGITPQDLLDAIMSSYELDEETAKGYINRIAREVFGQEINWELIQE